MNTGTVPTEEIKKALDAATPGPWSKIDGRIYGASTTAIDPLIYEFNEESERENKNANLITNAPTWLRSLLEENERLREALIKERDDAMIWDGITVVDRINKVLIQYATINESKPDTAPTPLG